MRARSERGATRRRGQVCEHVCVRMRVRARASIDEPMHVSAGACMRVHTYACMDAWMHLRLDSLMHGDARVIMDVCAVRCVRGLNLLGLLRVQARTCLYMPAYMPAYIRPYAWACVCVRILVQSS
jgi:hypothetical protein